MGMKGESERIECKRERKNLYYGLNSAADYGKKTRVAGN